MFWQEIYLKLCLYLRSVLSDLEYEANMTVPATAKMYIKVINKMRMNAIDWKKIKLIGEGEEFTKAEDIG